MIYRSVAKRGSTGSPRTGLDIQSLPSQANPIRIFQLFFRFLMPGLTITRPHGLFVPIVALI